MGDNNNKNYYEEKRVMYLKVIIAILVAFIFIFGCVIGWICIDNKIEEATKNKDNTNANIETEKDPSVIIVENDGESSKKETTVIRHEYVNPPQSKSNTSQNNSSNNDYIFPYSNCSYLTDDDLRYLSKEQLALARNEIFARHGYVFKMEVYRNYFKSKSWYVQDSSYDGSMSALNAYEQANVNLIQKWEAK